MQFQTGTVRRTPDDQSSPIFSSHHSGENTERRAGTKYSGKGGLLGIDVGERNAKGTGGGERKS